MPVYSFAFMPILTLLKVADFKSELLFLTKDKDKNYDIHFGSLFDCLLSGLFTNRKASFKKLMMFNVVVGLRNIIDDIEKGKIDPKAIIKGSSYFFNERNASRFGFSITETKNSHKYILMLNIMEIGFVYSFAQGRFALPNFSDFKSVKTTGAELVKHKDYIQSLVDRLDSKVDRNRRHSTNN